MGSLKFYRPMQAVWEILMFGGQTYSDASSSAEMLSRYSSKQSFSYCDNTNGLSGYFFSNAALTTAASNIKYPCFVDYRSYSAWFGDSLSGLPFLFQNSSSFADSVSNGLLHGTTNDVHDGTRNNLNNDAAAITIIDKVVNNGNANIILSITNNDASNAVTVKAIEKVGKIPASASMNSDATTLYYFLAWAYYLDQSEWITLDAGETKTFTLTIKMSDLTL